MVALPRRRYRLSAEKFPQRSPSRDVSPDLQSGIFALEARLPKSEGRGHPCKSGRSRRARVPVAARDGDFLRRQPGAGPRRQRREPALLPDKARPRHLGTDDIRVDRIRVRPDEAELKLSAARRAGPVRRAGAGARHRRSQRAVPQAAAHGENRRVRRPGRDRTYKEDY